jgi:K+-transporting ATPase KdpC subunit
MTDVKQAFESSHGGGAAEPGGSLLGHIWASIGATLILGVVCCGIYPLIVYGIGQILFPIQANGSLLKKDGSYTTNDQEAVGSALIGQNFSAPQYFHPRPSAAGNGYDATSSGGTNLGPLSAKLLRGTTKNIAFTVFASKDKGNVVTPVAGRVQGYVAEVTKATISLGPPPTTEPATSTPGTQAGSKTTYALDASVADPNTVVNYHGRTIHATTIPVGSLVELKLNDKTPAAVTGINVADQENDGGIAALDTTNNKITLDDSGGTVINIDPKNTAIIVGSKAAAITDLATGMSVHAVVSVQMDYDGIADRVIHYCQDNSITYKSSIPDSAFTDADGLDDMKLVSAFGAADSPTITPATLIPADAVTASGSGLDPHISPENAKLQAQRVADARKISKEKALQLINQFTDQPSLGILGDPGVNVLRLNIALDQAAPMPSAPPASQPAATATSAPAAETATPATAAK